MATRRVVLAAAAVLLLSACGGSSSPSFPTIQAARTYRLAGFRPAGPVQVGKPFTLSFAIRQPDGSALTDYRRGSGPHTGVHVILIRRDLADIVHVHPPVGPDGRLSVRITLPEPGPYRLVVDAYPNTTGPQRNFQLFGSVHAAGDYVPRPLGPSRAVDTTDGYRVAIVGAPRVRSLQAALLTVRVTAPDGRPARFTPWFGALAHAIFFRAGSLDYFHTHVCAPGASGCTSVLGGASVVGSSSTPGKLSVGVLLPVPGTWRLFLQCRVAGRVLTAPFTLHVS